MSTVVNFLKNMLGKNIVIILALTCCSYFLMYLHQYFTDLGFVEFNATSASLIIDAFSEDFFSEIATKRSMSIFFRSFCIAIFAKVLNDCIFSAFANFSKFLINSFYLSAINKLSDTKYAQIVTTSQTARSDYTYWEGKIITIYNISTVMLLLFIVFALGSIFGGVSTLFPIALFTIYVITFFTLTVYVLRYYVFSLAVDAVKNKNQHIASRRVRDLIA